jgi:UDP-N-acetylglucosamine 2-epimerase (non-hydrolysing)
MRVLSIVGTRPEALKMGPVLCALAAARGVESLVCATGQHRALLHRALALFNLRPDFDLALKRHGPTPDALAAALLLRLGPLVDRVQPDWIMAVGDTTSVLCASLAAAHHRVRFAHVEAGLRTDSKWDPFPEEFNRRITTVLADLHFAPTAHARQNLLQENIPAHRIIVTGNPIIDTLRQFSRQSAPAGLATLWRRLDLDRGNGAQPRLMVVTFHRRENIGPPMHEICAALRELARTYRGTVRILCIIHPNPEVREPARRDLTGVPHLVMSRPLDYPAMIAVLKRAHLVLTDSGGLQEEAPSLRIPVLVLRNRTERPEGVTAGAVKLVGTSRPRIVAAVRRLLDNPAAHRAMSRGFTGYGDGHAAKRIVRALQENKNT